MRPFLSSLWSALATTNDGPSARCVVRTRRIEPALEWIRHLLGGKAVPFVRIVRAFRPNTGAIVITDASTWGLGGTIAEFFSCPIPPEFVQRAHALPGLPKHMALWESLCLLIAARLWLVQFPLGAIVRVKADNIAALHLLARGKGSGPELSMVAREIALNQARGLHEFTLLEHLNNKTADPLSRQHDPDPPPFPSDMIGRARRVPISVSADFWKLPQIGIRSRKGERAPRLWGRGRFVERGHGTVSLR